jgi:hypothetical protein
MNAANPPEIMTFAEALQGLLNGDFTRLAPLFESTPEQAPCQIIRWYEEGLFAGQPAALAEAFSCACFDGHLDVVTCFLDRGVDLSGGMGTGMNAFHWAVNRGRLAVVRLLIRHGAPLETRNSYGGTMLGAGVWASLHETKPDHPRIIDELLAAGADVREAGYPTGDPAIDSILRKYGAAA